MSSGWRLHLKPYFSFVRLTDTEVGPIITAVTPTALRGGAGVGGAGRHRPAPRGQGEAARASAFLASICSTRTSRTFFVIVRHIICNHISKI